MDFNIKEEPQRISVINDALFQIQRLHNIWNEARTSRENGNLAKCRWCLDSAEIELMDDITKLDNIIKDKEEKYARKIDKINDELSKISLLKTENRIKFYNTLISKEKILRKVQNEIGKGAKFRDSEEDDMD